MNPGMRASEQLFGGGIALGVVIGLALVLSSQNLLLGLGVGLGSARWSVS
jgi:hypothetical protein